MKTTLKLGCAALFAAGFAAFPTWAEKAPTATAKVMAAEKAAAKAAARAAEKEAAAKAPEAEIEEKEDLPVWQRFHLSASVDVKSDYVWRGIILDDNPVWQPCFVGSFDMDDFGGLSVGYWASHDLTHRRNRIPYGGNSRMSGSIQEIDYWVGYSKNFGDLSWEIDYFWYDYPNNGKHTHHCAGHLSQDLKNSFYYNNPWVTPGVEISWGCTTQHTHDPSTLWVRFSAKHDFAITDALTLTPKTSMGVGDHAFTKAFIAGYRENSRDNYGTEITDHTLTLNASYAITKWLSIGANINYTWVPSHALRQERWMTAGHDSRSGLAWGGVSASVSF